MKKRGILLAGCCAAALALVLAAGRRPLRDIDPEQAAYVVASHSIPYTVKLVDRPEDIREIAETVAGLRVSWFPESDEALAGGHVYYAFYGENGELLHEVSVTVPRASVDGQHRRILFSSGWPLDRLYDNLDYPVRATEEEALAVLNPAPEPSPTPAPAPTPEQEVWHPYSGGQPVWLREGLLAVPDGNTVRLVGGENRLLRKVEPPDGLTGRMELGIGEVRVLGMVAGEKGDAPDGCYCLAHKDGEKSNGAGTVWVADESGARELFGGLEVGSFRMRDGVMLLDRHVEEVTSQAEPWHAAAADLEPHALDTFPFSQPVRIDDDRILFGDSSLNGENATLTCVFAETGEVRRYELDSGGVMPIHSFRRGGGVTCATTG